jgi:hypothetical protein
MRALAIEASRLAYLHAEDGAAPMAALTAALACAGFGAPTLFVDREFRTGTFGFGSLRAEDGLALLCFRGTQHDDLEDLITDLKFPPRPWPEAGGLVHDGFAAATRSVLPAVRQWLADTGAPPTRLLLCGHSLGAAIATAAASILKPAQLITIGSPRVGDADFASSLNAVAGDRIVDCADVVTRVPPAELGYVHVRPPVFIRADGGVVEARDGVDESAFEAGVWQAKGAYLLMHSWKPGHVKLRSFADHAPVNYLRAFY